MWQAARNFANGLFHEPRYYGQDYNTMLEGLLAAPLLWLGVPVYYAVPFITHVLFLFPFLFSAIYLFRTEKKIQALLVLTLLLCLPLGYDIMNSLPRGFVTGLFFCSFYILSIHNPYSLPYLFLNTFLAYTAYLVNQNSLLLTAPFLFYLFLKNYRSKNYYLCSLAAVMCAFPLDHLLNHFYKTNPEYIHYSFKNVFSWENFKDAISNLDQRFVHITFFAEGKSIILLLFFLLSGYLLFKHNKHAFYAYLLFLGLVLFSFFSSKIADGFTWAFYSYSRMYLALPLVFILLLSLVPIRSMAVAYLLIAVTISFSIYKGITLKDRLAYHVDPKKWGLIHLQSLKNAVELIDHYRKYCEKNNVNDLVIANDIFCKDEVGYGGPGLYNDYPRTLLSYSERRTWRIKEERLRIPERFILLINDYEFDKKGFDLKYKFRIIKQDDYGCFLIEQNKQTLPMFLTAIDQPINGIRE